MKKILSELGDASEPGPQGPRLVVGFGNIGGMGEGLVRHWEAVGRPRLKTSRVGIVDGI